MARVHAQTVPPPARLAIMPETPGAEALADALTAEFSQCGKVQLLERAEVEKVYREQELPGANRDYVKVGQILGADGLLLLEDTVEGSHQFINLRLIAVKPGVVLTARKIPWARMEMTKWPAALGKQLEGYFSKLAVLKTDAIPISIVNLRSSVVSAASEEAERQLKRLAIQRLSQEPRLFVLERQKLPQLGEEKFLNADESDFWNGSYLLDGAVDPDGFTPDTLIIKARLTPPKGGAPIIFVVSGSRTNLADIINQLANQVAVALKLVAQAPPWQPAEEASSYCEEAGWALHWGAFQEAAAAADTAWILGKQDLPCALLRVRTRLQELKTSSINYQYGTFTTSSNDGAEGQPVSKVEAMVQQEINRLKASHPVMLACHVSKFNRVWCVQYAFARQQPATATIAGAIRMLDLYLEFSRHFPEGQAKIISRGPGWNDWHNSEWYQLGLDSLAAASEVLRDFNYMPPAQTGAAEQLATLRERARATAFMMFNSPSVHESYYLGKRAATYDELSHTLGDNPNIFSCMINWGAYWQEKPEQMVALYQKLMESPAFCYLHPAFWSCDLLRPRLAACRT